MITDKKAKTVCFTGHREIRANDTQLHDILYETLESLILQGFIFFGAGGARGFDAFASEVVLELKEVYPLVKLILVLPFVNQYEHEKGWSVQEIEQYHRLKEKASKVVHTQEVYSSGCYYKRNKHLVDFSSVCVCYQYKNTGGTAYTTKYAHDKGIKIINVV